LTSTGNASHCFSSLPGSAFSAEIAMRGDWLSIPASLALAHSFMYPFPFDSNNHMAFIEYLLFRYKKVRNTAFASEGS
jgi:hypothetical protein